jgi:TRAP-type C4-dicarboxylate transport system permease small subunit
MVIFAFLQVILRGVFSQGILWGDILLRHLVLWLGFLGASLATRERKHINIDLITRFVNTKYQYLLKFLTNIVSAFICYLLFEAGYTFVMDERSMNSFIFNEIPAWYFQIIIPAGFLLMSFRFVLNAIADIATKIKGKEKK